MIFIFCCPCNFHKDIGKWPENQILIPDWTYFHCPGATLVDCKQPLHLVWDNSNFGIGHSPPSLLSIQKTFSLSNTATVIRPISKLRQHSSGGEDQTCTILPCLKKKIIVQQLM